MVCNDVGAGNIETITLTLTLNIPGLFAKPAVFFLLLYRRLRYGYVFRRIPLTRGKYAIVDPDDYKRLNKYTWHASGGGEKLYAKRVKKNRSVSMHREIITVPGDLVVDHINHNRLDNRKANLRPATPAQNSWNRLIKKRGNRFRGVDWDKKEKKWRTRLTHNRSRITMGYFDDELEAARTYDEAAKKLHGEFAVLNFPDNK